MVLSATVDGSLGPNVEDLFCFVFLLTTECTSKSVQKLRFNCVENIVKVQDM